MGRVLSRGSRITVSSRPDSNTARRLSALAALYALLGGTLLALRFHFWQTQGSFSPWTSGRDAIVVWFLAGIALCMCSALIRRFSRTMAVTCLAVTALSLLSVPLLGPIQVVASIPSPAMQIGTFPEWALATAWVGFAVFAIAAGLVALRGDSQAWPTWRLLALTGAITALVLACIVLGRGEVWAGDMTEGDYSPSNPMAVTVVIWLVSACLAFVVCAAPRVGRRGLYLVFASAAGGFVGAAVSGVAAHLKPMLDVPYWLADPGNHAQLALVWSLAALQLVVSGVLMLQGRETIEPVSG